MTTFFDILDEKRDTRSKHGKRFKFVYFLTYLICAELAGANSVRKKEAYLIEHRRAFYELFGEHWHVAPSKTTINDFINSLDESYLAELLCFFDKTSKNKSFHTDGKNLRGSGQNILNLFTEKTRQCVGKFEFKSGGEIEAVYNVLKLGIFNSGDWVSADALHCQKKLF